MKINKILLLVIISCVFVGLIAGVTYKYFLNYNSNNNAPPSNPSKIISINDVTTNNSANSCWVILGGVVYDATSLVAKYPQYNNQILSVCGKDGYSVFVDQKYSQSAINSQDLPKLKQELTANKIGILAP